MSLSSLSLSFDELRALQVDIRLKDGTFAVDLQPLGNYRTTVRTSDTSPLPEASGQDSGLRSEYFLHLHVLHDNLGPVLQIFTSQTRVPPSKPLRYCHDLATCDDENIMAYSGDGNRFLVPNGEHAVRNAPCHEQYPPTFNILPSSDVDQFDPKLFPWAASDFPSGLLTSSHSFSDEGSMSDDFSATAINDGNIHSWSPQLLFNSFGNKKDLISVPVLGDSSALILPSKLMPTTPLCPPPHGSETSVHASQRPFPPASSSRANSSPPYCESTHCAVDTSDAIVTSSREMLVPSIWSEDEETGGKPFACTEYGCSRRFKNQHTLRSHMETHKSKRTTLFPCTLGCSERFTRQHDRLRHEVAKHGKICEWLCEHCGRFFSSRKTLAHHRCPMTVGGTRWVN